MAPKKKVGERAGEVKVTRKQQDLLIQLLLERPKLGRGKLDQHYTNIERKKDWEQVALILNGSGLGPVKTWEKWNRCWNDLKSKIKGKKAEIARSRRLTGGGEGTSLQMEDLEERVFEEFMSNTVVFGDGNVEEAGVGSAPMDIPVETSAEVLEPLLPEGAEIIQRVDEFEPPIGLQEWVPIHTPVVDVVYSPLPPVDSPILAESPVPVMEEEEEAEEEEEEEEEEGTGRVPSRAGTSGRATPTVRKRRRTHAAQVTLDETVALAGQFAEAQQKTSETLERLTNSVDQLTQGVNRLTQQVVDSMQRQVAIEEQRTAVFERFTSAVELIAQSMTSKK